MTTGSITACDGVFYDNGGGDQEYPNNENRSMTFCSGTTDIIIFDFLNFDISTADTLYVYDGTTTSSQLIGAYTGTQIPEKVYSKTGNCITFKFVSNEDNIGDGWRALISCSASEPAKVFNMQYGERHTCGGTFFDNGGSASNYNTSFIRYMTFHSDNGNQISFNFQEFSLYGDSYDYLAVYDGPSLSYPQIGKYYGTDSPGIITSTGTSLTFYFYSSGSYVSSGWEADISCGNAPLNEYPMTSGTINVCDGIFSDNNGQADDYSNNEDRTMTFCSGTTDNIAFEFSHFDVSVIDLLYVYDGSSTSDPLIGIYTGSELPETIYSKSGTCVTFRFVSNSATTKPGWRAFISCLSAPPVQEFNMQYGERYTCGGT